MPQIVKARVEPDGSIHLLESVRLTQAVEVDVVLPEDAVIESQTDTATQNVLADLRARRLAWMKANREQYGGQYVALDGDLLIGVGNNYPEAARAAKAAGIQNAFITYLPRPDEVGEMGGWQ